VRLRTKWDIAAGFWVKWNVWDEGGRRTTGEKVPCLNRHGW
jgi:hypothetical protein